MYVKSQSHKDRLPAKTTAVALAIGDIVYETSAGAWAKADADGSGTYPARGVVTRGVSAAAATAGIKPEVSSRALIAGYADSTFTVGASLFLSDSVGEASTTAPATATDCLQQIGYAPSATEAMFDFGSGKYTLVPAT